MGVQIKVVLDKPHAVYCSGETVSGKIVLLADEPTKVRGSFVQVVGYSVVLLSGTEPSCLIDTNVEHTKVEKYIDIIAGEIKTDEALQTIPARACTSYFNFVIPKDIPSSFETNSKEQKFPKGQAGCVRYFLKTAMATVHGPQMPYWAAEVPFYVINPLDLNAYPELLEPVTKQIIRTISSSKGQVTIKLTLPSGGALPEEILFPNLVIENKSSVNVGLIKLKLAKEITLKTDESTKTTRFTISKKSLGYVDAGQSKVFDREAFPIPALPPCNLNACRIIDINYFLEAHCDFDSYFYRKTIVKVPVVIGTVPFRRNEVPQNPPLATPLP